MTTALKIMVVDDDTDAADSLAELFELEGHEAIAVYGGDDAIETARSHDFDLAFMDVMMPGRNGVESFIEIRKFRPQAKVYMMTGYSVSDLLDQAVNSGVSGVFSKPVDLDKIFDVLAANAA